MNIVLTGRECVRVCLGRREVATAGWERVNNGWKTWRTFCEQLCGLSRAPFNKAPFLWVCIFLRCLLFQEVSKQNRSISWPASQHVLLYMSQLAFWFINHCLEYLVDVSQSPRIPSPLMEVIKSNSWMCRAEDQALDLWWPLGDTGIVMPSWKQKTHPLLSLLPFTLAFKCSQCDKLSSNIWWEWAEPGTLKGDSN